MSDQPPEATTFKIGPSAYQRRLQAAMAAQGMDVKGRPLTDTPTPRKPISFDGAPLSMKDPGEDRPSTHLLKIQPNEIKQITASADPTPRRHKTTGFIFPNNNYQEPDFY